MHYTVAIILLQIHSYKSIPFESVSEFWVLDRAMLQRRGAQDPGSARSKRKSAASPIAMYRVYRVWRTRDTQGIY